MQATVWGCLMADITVTTLKSILKHYIYRVFDNGVYIKTWTKEVLSSPDFRSNINGGAGELIIQLGRPFDDFGEDVDVKLNNTVEVYVVDNDSPNGVLFYSGFIVGYEPTINEASETVKITLFGFASKLQDIILRDGSGVTTITYNSYDPSAILKDVIDKLRAQGLSLTYTASSVQNTNTVVSYTFNTNTGKECFDKIIELCPVGWFWRVDADNVVYLQSKNVFADHTFTLGLDVEKLRTHRRIEDIVNQVLVVGGGVPALFRKYNNSASIATYGLREKKIVDQRVTVVATAAIMANREIDTKKDPEIRSIFEIIDNNGPSSRGYNIETIKAGQTLNVKNLRTASKTVSNWDIAFWDVDVYDQTLATLAADVIQILSVQYTPDSVILEASSRLPQIAKRIEDVSRNLEVTQLLDVPASPT